MTSSLSSLRSRGGKGIDRSSKPDRAPVTPTCGGKGVPLRRPWGVSVTLASSIIQGGGVGQRRIKIWISDRLNARPSSSHTSLTLRSRIPSNAAINSPHIWIGARYRVVDKLDVTDLHCPSQHCVGERLATRGTRRESRFQSLRRRFSGSKKRSHPRQRGITHLPVNGSPGAFRAFLAGTLLRTLPLRLAVVTFHNSHARLFSIFRLRFPQ